MSSIGPALPPHLQRIRHQSPQEKDSGKESGTAGPSTETVAEDEDDDFGPALPPHLLAKRKAAVAGPARPPSRDRSASPAFRKRNVGPALPPHLASQQGHESDSDEDVGPSIHMASKEQSEGDGVREFLEREARIAKEREVRRRTLQASAVCSSSLCCRKPRSRKSSKETNGCWCRQKTRIS